MDRSILYGEVSLTCVLVLLLLLIRLKNAMMLQERRRLLGFFLVVNILFLALDSFWIFVNQGVIQISYVMNWGLNGVYYILSAFAGYSWYVYSSAIQDDIVPSKMNSQLIRAIPLIVIIVMTGLSIWTGWLFYIDEMNLYHRGPLYILQLLVAYGYVLYSALRCFYLVGKTTDYHSQRSLRALGCYVIPSLIAGSLQACFPDYPILCIGTTLGTLYVYLELQSQMISLDGLTKLNNRNQLFQFLSNKMTHVHEDANLYLMIMDIDWFKQINDQFGHVEGDVALKCVADVLRKSCRNKNYFISRYGGDEFIEVCELEPNETMEDVSNSIHTLMHEIEKPYELSVSIGYAKYKPSYRTIQDFINAADQQLYQQKAKRKEKDPHHSIRKK